MILAAGYLLYMFGRVVFGEVSGFLEGLGHHLTDMTATEVLTLVPLGALVVAFGIQPGLLLELFPDTVDQTLDVRARRARRSPSPRRSSIGLIALLVVAIVVARIGYVLPPARRARRARRHRATTVAEGGAAH